MAVIRTLDSISDLERVTDLESAVWDIDPREAVPANLLHASIVNGGVVFGGFDGDRTVGMAYAFPARRDGKWMLWSHMTGVHRDYQGQGIGFALKQAQRLWALEHDYTYIAWTFDPLQRGNAHFNLHLLGASANVYHVDFYGEMSDGINAGLPSDRLEVRWDLRSPRVAALADGVVNPVVKSYPDAHFLLNPGSKLEPVTHTSELNLPSHFIEIPSDLSQLKRSNATLAYEWRIALRQVLQSAFDYGYTLVDFVEAQGRCCYVLMSDTPWFLYVLVCNDDSLYTGVTTDMKRRLRQHNAGHGAAYTAARRPVRMVAAWRFPNRSQALQAEVGFKRFSRAKKLQFLRQSLDFRGATFVNCDALN
jgi:predicted GNAT superfamily acetyltransferase/predicted GIY-YIG superfamily endonuclease